MKRIIKWIWRKFLKNVRFWIFFGFLSTLSYVFLAILGEVSISSAFFNIIAMLGSGVFCSSVVSYLFEIESKKKKEKEINQKKEFYFRYLIHCLHEVILSELTYVCESFNIKYTTNNSLDIGISISDALSTLDTQYSKILKDKICFNDSLKSVSLKPGYENVKIALESLINPNIQFIIIDLIGADGLRCLFDLSNITENVINHYSEIDEDLIHAKLVFFNYVKSAIEFVCENNMSLLNFYIEDTTFRG